MRAKLLDEGARIGIDGRGLSTRWNNCLRVISHAGDSILRSRMRRFVPSFMTELGLHVLPCRRRFLNKLPVFIALRTGKRGRSLVVRGRVGLLDGPRWGDAQLGVLRLVSPGIGGIIGDALDGLSRTRGAPRTRRANLSKDFVGQSVSSLNGFLGLLIDQPAALDRFLDGLDFSLHFVLVDAALGEVFSVALECLALRLLQCGNLVVIAVDGIGERLARDGHAALAFASAVRTKSFGVTAPPVASKIRRCWSARGMRSSRIHLTTPEADTSPMRVAI